MAVWIRVKGKYSYALNLSCCLLCTDKKCSFGREQWHFSIKEKRIFLVPWQCGLGLKENTVMRSICLSVYYGLTKNVGLGGKNGIFRQNVHEAFWLSDFSIRTTGEIILFKVVPNKNAYLL
jgi:hypothetical protein